MKSTTMFFAMICAMALPCAAAQQPPQTPQQPPRTQTQTTGQSTTRTVTPSATTPPAPPAPPAPPPVKMLPVNVKIEITITAIGGTVPPTKKTVTLVTGDGLQGSIRNSASDTRGFPTTPFNIDERPTVLPDGKIRLTLTLTYDTPTSTPDSPTAVAAPRAGLNESLQLVLDSGKPIVVAESPAPIGDFIYTVEVKATILK
jgi:hypothetical protein